MGPVSLNNEKRRQDHDTCRSPGRLSILDISIVTTQGRSACEARILVAELLFKTGPS